MGDIERINAAKREFKNIITRTEYNDYDSNTFKPIELRLNGLEFENEKAVKLQNLLNVLIESLDTIDAPNKSKWNLIKQKFISSKEIMNGNNEPFNSCTLASSIVRVWNIILAFQYHIENKTMPSNI